jgi:hypothetical protein
VVCSYRDKWIVGIWLLDMKNCPKTLEVFLLKYSKSVIMQLFCLNNVLKLY